MRTLQEDICKLNKLIESTENIKLLLDKLPYFTMLLDENRQIVYANKALIEGLGLKNIDTALGVRPGELLNCIYEHEGKEGCGSGDHCRYCGCVKLIFQCLESKQNVRGDCRVSTAVNGQALALDLRLSASILDFGSHSFVLVSVQDISMEKHKERFERVFFHDALNISVGISGLIYNMKSNPQEDIPEMVNLLEVCNKQLSEEISTYSDIVSAEKGTFQVIKTCFDVKSFVHEIVSFLKYYPAVYDGKKIETIIDEQITEICTDKIILRRVLVNLIKNALEATPSGETVTICVEIEDENVVFAVKNPKVMPEEVQSQIFQRSFSTKGANRGIGTYSVRLFVVNYLKGSVSFVSEPGTGTIFYVKIPL